MHFSILNNNATHRWMWPVKHVYVRASRQTQAGIGHSAPAHRGGHVQNRSRRREQRRGSKKPIRRQSNHGWTDDQAGRRRLTNADSDGGSRVHAADDTPSKNAATRARHCNFMRPGGGTTQCSSRVEEERDETSRGSHNRGMSRRKWCKQHRHLFAFQHLQLLKCINTCTLSRCVGLEGALPCACKCKYSTSRIRIGL